jgi:hypothetical protein
MWAVSSKSKIELSFSLNFLHSLNLSDKTTKFCTVLYFIQFLDKFMVYFHKKFSHASQ